jgi:hypothetical protein
LKGGRDVAARFVETVLSRLMELKATAGIHAKIFGHHRMLVTPFPFAIYYDMRSEYGNELTNRPASGTGSITRDRMKKETRRKPDRRDALTIHTRS